MTQFDWWLLFGIIPTGTAVAYAIVTFIAQLIWGDENDNYRNYFDN